MVTAATVQHVEFTKVLPAATSEIWARLVDPARLREWFCEQAEVEPRVNGAYRFWGRHTPLMPRARDATQRITRFDADRALRFAWAWGGTDSEVLIELTPEGEAAAAPRTSVWVRHSLIEGTVGGYSRDTSRFFVGDFWTIALGNLREHVKRGAAALRPDFAAQGPNVRVSIEIDAAPERVWNALVDPAVRDKWLSSGGVCEARKGGAYTYGWVFDGEHCGPKTILEIDPPRRLVHDWFHAKEAPGRTEWVLEPLAGGRTRVTVTQVGVNGDRDVAGYTGGWSKFALGLRELLEGPNECVAE